MSVKLLVDLRPAPTVVEAVVHPKCQPAEFVGVPVVSPHRADGDGVGHVAVGGFFAVPVDQGEPHHDGRDQSGQQGLAQDIDRGPGIGQNTHDSAGRRIAHDREIGQRGDGSLSQQRPDGSHFPLERRLTLLRGVWKRHAEELEAFPGRRQRVSVARHVLVLQAPQPIDPGLVQVARRAPEQDRELLLRRRVVPTQVLRLGGLEVEGKGEVVVLVPQLVAHHLEPGSVVPERRVVRRGGLGLLPGTQVEAGERQPLGRIVEQGAPEVQVVRDVEQALIALVALAAGLQQPAHREVSHPLLLGGNEGVGRLLDPIVQEGVPGGPGSGQDQALLDRAGQILRDVLGGLLAHDGEGLQIERIADTRRQCQRALGSGREPLDLPGHQVDDVVGHPGAAQWRPSRTSSCSRS